MSSRSRLRIRSFQDSVSLEVPFKSFVPLPSDQPNIDASRLTNVDGDSILSLHGGLPPSLSLDAGPSNTNSAKPAESPSASANAGELVERLGSAKTRTRRSMSKPEWVAPPRVLLVDNDAMSRRLVSEFLQVFGCTIDIALHGFAAVNKLNTERYDLVLMVGVSFLSPLNSLSSISFYSSRSL